MRTFRVSRIRWGMKGWLGTHRQRLLHIFALLVLFSTIWLAWSSAHANSFDHTSATVDSSCQQFTFSSDGNPYPLCPGPMPQGGNCVWWAWEQWHLLGYDLPLNWGNPVDWIVSAERFGLPVGTAPRVGSLAVFPVDDGLWAYTAAGHVAFVTWVSSDSQTFNVTYQNYGDSTPMYIGGDYNVSVINEPRFQQGQLRFLYFPEQIDPNRFANLPGVKASDVSGVENANAQLNNGNGRVALGLAPGAYDQEFKADFANLGLTDLLLYNREQGSIDILSLSYPYDRYLPQDVRHYVPPGSSQETYRVSLHDDQTGVNGWGPNLQIHLGDFTGSGETEILLYDRVSGKIQLLTLTPQFAIAKHVTFNGWGPDWEIYVGRFDGQRSELLMYKRFAIPAPVPTPTPQPTPSPTPKPTKSPSPTPKASPTPKPTATPSPTPKPTPTSTHTASQEGSSSVLLDGYPADQTQAVNLLAGGGEPVDTSGKSPASWTKSGLTAKFLLVSFTRQFTLGTTQSYALWHNSWEVYIGSFVGADRDGVFLYDRNVGEARLVSFSPQLTLGRFQFLHNLGGNWEVHVGDFAGQGQAQVLLYNVSTGDAEILLPKKDLSVGKPLTYSGWGAGLVLYVGHFGMRSLSLMLYDPQKKQSTFIAFDASLNVSHQYNAHSWGQDEQILVGAFLDRSQCLVQYACSTGDDILVLNRKTGQVQQYIFSFGNQFGIFDNRAQGFIRKGIATTESVLPVDGTRFSLLTSLNTTIRGEELY
jgi:surface antigen